ATVVDALVSPGAVSWPPRMRGARAQVSPMRRHRFMSLPRENRCAAKAGAAPRFWPPTMSAVGSWLSAGKDFGANDRTIVVGSRGLGVGAIDLPQRIMTSISTQARAPAHALARL